ncbi:hypothetical protein THITH_11455 [Thioalkalivibrio paradoxus ARh 1]|uniref:Uncharacterized protein n=1 Tax=Thioalkalivibrio paradoxus ARh 1 TaxID=713585 RepID=W0DSG0_9GAMM|nr:hypothetical protein THITH_11455 [Thioalkalivibrio paradoxus ARh 1]
MDRHVASLLAMTHFPMQGDEDADGGLNAFGAG